MPENLEGRRRRMIDSMPIGEHVWIHGEVEEVTPIRGLNPRFTITVRNAGEWKFFFLAPEKSPLLEVGKEIRFCGKVQEHGETHTALSSVGGIRAAEDTPDFEGFLAEELGVPPTECMDTATAMEHDQPFDLKVLRVLGGWLQELPENIPKRNQSSWLAAVEESPTARGGIDRHFLPKAAREDTGRFYYVQGKPTWGAIPRSKTSKAKVLERPLVAGDPLEFGWRRVLRGVRQESHKLYCVVLAITDHQLILQIMKAPMEAFRLSEAIKAQGGSTRKIRMAQLRELLLGLHPKDVKEILARSRYGGKSYLDWIL